jgi:hypothetical protein
MQRQVQVPGRTWVRYPKKLYRGAARIAVPSKVDGPSTAKNPMDGEQICGTEEAPMTNPQSPRSSGHGGVKSGLASSGPLLAAMRRSDILERDLWVQPRRAQHIAGY